MTCHGNFNITHEFIIPFRTLSSPKYTEEVLASHKLCSRLYIYDLLCARCIYVHWIGSGLLE